MSEPKAEKKPYVLKKHGDTRIDNYFWIKEKSSPKVLDYLKVENSYTQDAMKDTLDFQEKLYQEMRGRIKEEDTSVPFKKGGYEYFTKTIKGEQYPLYLRKKINASEEIETILDVNQLAKGFDSYHVTYPDFFSNQDLFAYAADTKGDRVYTIYFKEQSTGKILNQKIANVTGDFVWAEGEKILFYTKQDPKTLRADKVYRYDFKEKKSTLVFQEKDEKFEVGIYKTLANQFIYITVNSTLTSEVRYVRADNPKDSFKVFQKRQKDIIYSVQENNESFFVLTNAEATNFRIMTTDFKHTEKKYWKELIAHRSDVLIDNVLILKNYFVVTERSKGLTQIQVRKLGSREGKYIEFLDPAYTVGLSTNSDYESPFVRYEFESMNRPSSIFDFNFESQVSVLKKEKEIINYNSNDYVSKRMMATAKDGTKIPISLVYSKKLKLDGTNPIFVYGYGSYGISTDPYFSSTRVSLLDRGFVFAIIHIRGGSEMGRSWYEDGKFFKKKNTFTDFIDGTEFLVKEKMGSPEKIFANGGSAGGLLMGAIINLKPELYKGVVADVPFVDVVTTMLDSSIPLTTGEYEEWGNPNDKKYYEYMKSYSPYDNVTIQDYPHLLVTTGLNDSQVAYWEPTKWVAKLRDLRKDQSKLLLLKIEMEVGHGGRSGRFDYLKEEAFSDAFIFKILNITK